MVRIDSLVLIIINFVPLQIFKGVNLQGCNSSNDEITQEQLVRIIQNPQLFQRLLIKQIEKDQNEQRIGRSTAHLFPNYRLEVLLNFSIQQLEIGIVHSY